MYIIILYTKWKYVDIWSGYGYQLSLTLKLIALDFNSIWIILIFIFDSVYEGFHIIFTLNYCHDF